MSIEATFGRVRDRALGTARRLSWLAPLAIRVVVGTTFVLTGWGKLSNLDGLIRYFESLGIPAAGVQAPFVASVELVGGVLILAGLATRVAALLLTGVMAVAIYTAIWPKADGVTDVLASIEAIYLVTFLHLAAHGAGAVSLDHLAAKHIPALRPAVDSQGALV